MKAKKHFGQHFLTKDETASAIVGALGDIRNENVLEIGPGMGMLSKFLIKKSKTFQAIEIDKDAANFLEKHFPNIQLIRADFLKVDLRSHFNNQFSLIGNFPYNISSQIVFKIIEHSDLIPNWVGMFQYEMGIRLVAQPSNKKDYGVLSVLLPFYYSLELLMKLPPSEFNPPPKVTSTVIKATKTEYKPKCDMKVLKRVVKTAFGQRRKTLSNSLSSILPKDILNTHHFATLRPENLTYLQFEELCLFVEKHVSH